MTAHTDPRRVVPTRWKIHALLAALACLVAASPGFAGEGTMFRGNAAHTGVYVAPAIPAPELKWRFHSDAHFIASPALAGGLALVGATDGTLYALDLATGKEKWSFKTGARIASSAAVSDGLVLFESYDGNFYALDAKTGTRRWSFATGGERRFAAAHLHGTLPAAEVMPDPFDFYLSSPAVAKGLVYFGSGDGHVYALDARTGALKWKFETGNVVHASPAVANGMVYIGSWDTYFYALEAATGAPVWKFKTGDDPAIHNQEGIQSSAAVSGGIVYFGCRDSNLYALDARTGRKLWSYDNKGSWVIGSPAVRNGVVYWATADTGLFHALDAKTGASRFTLDFHHWPMFSSPVLAGSLAYFGSHDGHLYAVDTAKGARAWSFETDGAKANAAALTNPDGTPNYRAAFLEHFYDALIVGVTRMMQIGAVLSSPAVAPDGTVVFGSMDGNVYALKAANAP